MEQGRLFLAIVLSIVVFLIWSIFLSDFFSPQPPPPKQTQEGQTARETATKEEPYIKEKDSAVAETAPLAQIARDITVDTPLYSVKISAKGAVFKSYVLKKYWEKIGTNSPNKEMVSADTNKGTLQLSFNGNNRPDLTEVIFSIDTLSDSVLVSEKPFELPFSWVSDQGIVVEKKFIFSPNTYLIGLQVTIKNGSSAVFSDQLALTLTKASFDEARAIGFQGPSTLIDDRLEQIKLKKIKDKNVYGGNLKWIAIQDRYFLSSIIPQKPVDAQLRLFLKDDNYLEAQYLQPESVVEPGTQQTFEYQLYLGPKSTKTLSRYDNDLDQAIEFGWFDFLAKPVYGL